MVFPPPALRDWGQMMSRMKHFPKYSIVLAHMRVELDLGRLGKRLAEAQEWLGQQVLQGCRAKMPLRTGSLQQRSYTEDGGRKVIFQGPYARYLYGGKVMVDSVTGKGPRKIPTGPNEYVLRFRKGATLRATDRPLKYTRSEARDHWFDAAKAEYGDQWVAGIKRMFGG